MTTLTHPSLPSENRGKPAERQRERDKKRASLTALWLFIMLPYSVFNCELAWQ